MHGKLKINSETEKSIQVTLMTSINGGEHVRLFYSSQAHGKLEQYLKIWCSRQPLRLGA